MSAFVTHRPTAAPFSGLFGTLVRAYAGWNDARVTRSALSRLSDRELDDIGLCRGDIEDIANRA